MKTKKSLSLSFKLGGTMVVVVILAIAMATALNFLRFEETYKRLIAQRLDVTAQEVARAVTTGLDLGLRIESQGNLPAQIAQMMATHPDIAISVHDCRGQIIVGKKDESDRPWLDNLNTSNWRMFSETHVGVGMMVRDNLGKCAGGVAVEMASAVFVKVMTTVFWWFLSMGGLLTAAACLMTVGSAMLFDRRHQAIQSLEQDLSTVVTGGGVARERPLSADDFADPWEQAVAECYLDARRQIVAKTSKPTTGCGESSS